MITAAAIQTSWHFPAFQPLGINHNLTLYFNYTSSQFDKNAQPGAFIWHCE